MFHSTHVFTGETIYRRPAQSYTEFTDELNCLQTLQQTFAQSSIPSAPPSYSNLPTASPKTKNALPK